MGRYLNETNNTRQVRIKLRKDLLDEFDIISNDSLNTTLNQLLQAHIAAHKEKQCKRNH